MVHAKRLPIGWELCRMIAAHETKLQPISSLTQSKTCEKKKHLSFEKTVNSSWIPLATKEINLNEFILL
jgi:hypothetical protein